MRKVVFFDIDGTLMNSDNQLPESTKQAMALLKKNGHIPVIATGRPPQMLDAIAKELKIENYISMNGQYIVMKGDPIFSNPLPVEDLEKLIALSYELGDRTFLMTADQVIGNTFMEEMMEPEFMSYVYKHFSVLPTEVGLKLFKHMTEKPILKERYENKDILMAFVHTPETKDHLYRINAPNLHFTRATPLFGEAIMKGSHKATGMQRVLDYLGASVEDTVAFGDSLNDIEMLSFAQIGVAMGNGRQELKNISDYVTTHVDEDGILEGLRYLNLI